MLLLCSLLCDCPSEMEERDPVPIGCSPKVQLSQVFIRQVTSPLSPVVSQFVNGSPLFKVSCSKLETMIQVQFDQCGNEQVSFRYECSCWIQFY